MCQQLFFLIKPFKQILRKKSGKAVASHLLARDTHSLVSDQVVLNGGTAVVLLDPVDLKSIAPSLDLDYQFGGSGFPYTRQTKAARLVHIDVAVAHYSSLLCSNRANGTCLQGQLNLNVNVS